MTPAVTSSASRSPVRPYLAGVHANWLGAGHGPAHRSVDGTLLFVDISGFTPLTERLARRGKEGAERLTYVLNGLFSRLLDVADGEGGDCLKFGGDALLILFEGPGHPARAKTAARQMLGTVRDFRLLRSDIGAVRLGMSAGIHTGEVLFVLAGDRHRELLVVGPAVTETLNRESEASSGRIRVSAASQVAREPTANATVALAVDVSDARIADGLPPELAGFLTGEHQEGEHRLATVGFVQFAGTDGILAGLGPDELAASLHDLIMSAQVAAEKHEVTLLSTDVDKDAGKIILAAGVPAGNDGGEDGLILALQEIVGADSKLRLRAGAHRGRVFAVDLGGANRRTFTVIGDTVNTAARIMGQAAPGQVLASTSLLGYVRSRFQLTEPVELRVKGKAAPIEAAGVGPALGLRSDAELDASPMINRTRELQTIREAVARAHEGFGFLIEISGPPGIGKSRLTASARGHAAEIPVLTVEAGRYSRATPYFAMRSALRRILGLPAPPQTVTVEALTRRVEEVSADLVRWLPLIGAVVGVDVEENEATRLLDVSYRASRLRTVVVQLVAAAAPGPLMWIVEDAHWLDAASSELLEELVAGVERRPWGFLVTRRPEPTGFRGEDPAWVRLELEPLSDEDASRLVEESLGPTGIAMSPEVHHDLIARSGGNPLFLQELIRAAATEKVSELPETIEALVSIGIDALPPSDRGLLRRAAVLGAHFPTRILAATLEEAEDQLRADLTRLGHFLRIDDGRISFRHVLLRDVAYEALPYRTRRSLHSRAGDAWAEMAGGDGSEVAELLSVHYHAAGRYEDSWRHSVAAARRSERNAAPVEAAAFYARALDAAKQLPSVEPAEQAGVAERLGDMNARSGRYEDARSAYRHARRLSNDPLRSARLHRKTGTAWEQEGRFSEAARSCKRGLTQVEAAAEDGSVLKEKAKLFSGYGAVLLRQGRHVGALPFVERAVALAEQAGGADARSALAGAYRLLDWAHTELGLDPGETYTQRALRLYEDIGDEMGQAHTLNNMGIAAYYRGDWERAASYYERCHEAAGRAGSTVVQAVVLNNIAEIRSDQGRLQEAEDLLQESLATIRGARHQFEGMVLGNLGRAAARAGRFDEADERYRSAEAFLQRIGETALLVETYARQAELLLLAGTDPAAALETANRVRNAAERMSLPLVTSLADRVAGYALVQRGESTSGWARLSRSVMSSRENKDSYGAALGQEGLARVAALRGWREIADRFDMDAAATFGQLGVLATPDVPLPRGLPDDKPLTRCSADQPRRR